jgi:ATP-dependent DNA helicase RecQ
MVSTMHKAKGKEFDNVYLLLDHYPLHKTEDKRVLYMAITRAKNHLVIHTNTSYFDSFNVENMIKEKDPSHYEAPQKIILQCSMEDVWLGYFKNSAVIRNVNKLASGDKLAVARDDPFKFVNESGNPVLKLSTQFKEKIRTLFEKGYHVAHCKAGYIIIWKDKEDLKNYRVVLPDIILKKGK